MSMVEFNILTCRNTRYNSQGNGWLQHWADDDKLWEDNGERRCKVRLAQSLILCTEPPGTVSPFYLLTQIRRKFGFTSLTAVAKLNLAHWFPEISSLLHSLLFSPLEVYLYTVLIKLHHERNIWFTERRAIAFSQTLSRSTMMACGPWDIFFYNMQYGISSTL